MNAEMVKARFAVLKTGYDASTVPLPHGHGYTVFCLWTILQIKKPECCQQTKVSHAVSISNKGQVHTSICALYMFRFLSRFRIESRFMHFILINTKALQFAHFLNTKKETHYNTMPADPLLQCKIQLNFFMSVLPS